MVEQLPRTPPEAVLFTESPFRPNFKRPGRTGQIPKWSSQGSQSLTAATALGRWPPAASLKDLATVLRFAAAIATAAPQPGHSPGAMYGVRQMLSAGRSVSDKG